ncbi:pericentrin isoform B [Alligator mississippiensis]|uniref:Pericentrin isoform B n=1 Tax=Alligator mississippiensis TaxID=8496 RepID=A0A151N9T4_ALLMI|nr:pericentrin isoform B [Alligator mississippiensis]
MEDEERQRKLEAGRAKLAHFRQRKTKSENTQSQKKAAKRKGSSIHTHDIPKEECTLVAQVSDFLSDLGMSMESQTEDPDVSEASFEAKGDSDLPDPDVLDNHAVEELETAVQERNKIITRLTSNLQQAQQNQDDIQEETSFLMDQIHGLQLQLLEANLLLKNKIPGKNELAQAQQQMAVFQNRLKEQSEHLQILHQKAHDLEVELESSQKNTKDKENSLAQMEENLKSTIQQLHKNIAEKEETIKRLQDTVTSEKASFSMLKNTLSLRDTEITDLKNEMASAKMKEKEYVKELNMNHNNDICRQLQELRAELEESHRKEILRLKEVCEEEINSKYKNELEQIKRELSAMNTDADIQKLNSVIIDLNNQLHESDSQRDNLSKKLKNQMLDFQRERSEIELRYKDLIDDLKSQLSNADEQIKEAYECKQEKEHLNEEIYKLNSLIQELKEKLLLETETNTNLRQKHDEERTIYSMKLKKLEQEEKLLQEVSQSQKAELEKIQSKLSQYEGEIQLVPKELEFPHGLQVGAFKNELENFKKNVEKFKARKDNESYEADNLSEEHMAELGSFTGDEDILAKYLVSTERQEHSVVSNDSELFEIEESRFVLDSNNFSEPYVNSRADTLSFGPDKQMCSYNLLQATSEDAELEAKTFASFLSDSSLPQDKVGNGNEEKDEEKTRLIERCVELIKQLREKELALNKSHQETQEAIEKWEKTKMDLSFTQLELEKEHEVRLCCEKELDEKTKKEKELENKLNFLEKQREDRDIIVCVEELENLEKAQDCERLEYEEKLISTKLEIQRLNAEIEAKNTEYIQKEKNLTDEMAYLKNCHLDRETCLQEALQKSEQAIQEVQSEMKKHYEEEISKIESQHFSETTNLSLAHQKEIEKLYAEIREKVEKQQKLEEERKEQIALIKKVHEREHDREIAELIAKHDGEMKELRAMLSEEQQQVLDELQQQMEAGHQVEIQHAQLQSQTLYNLELEALRLSLSNMHTSQLELTQSNLRKEKETALMELREMLNDKRAQEIAILQSRHQFELEHIKEHNQKEKEEIELKHQDELVDLRKNVELEMEEKHIQTLETLKGDWAVEAEMCLKMVCEELSEKHQTELDELQKALKAELQKVKEELKSLSLEKGQVETKYKDLENQHELAIIRLREQIQTECDQCLEEMKRKSSEREQEIQQQLEKLQATHKELKVQSQQEIKQLWSQLDSTRASRQELSELKEQLLARTSHVEEIECLKHEFEQHQQQQRREHETELEQLRIYFEKKLRAAEENYREELALLHQRLQEVKEYSLMESETSQDQLVDISSSIISLEEATEKERRDVFCQLNQQLEQHKEELTCLRLQLDEQHRNDLHSLRSSLTLQYKEDLMKMKMDLSDRYISEIEELKKKHCLDLEQLRAKLSEEHIKEITKLRLQSAQDAARQVEAEVAERISVLEKEHREKLSLLQSEKQYIEELQEERQHLKKEISELKHIGMQHEMHMKEEMEKVKCKLLEDHNNELKKAKEKVQKMEQIHKEKEEEWKCESELLLIKTEEKLSLMCRELEDKAECERLALQKEFELHEAEMNLLRDEQAARIVELEKSLKEQQNSLRQLEDSLANEQATHKSQAEYDSELQAAEALMAKELEKATLDLQEECAAKLTEAQNKFIEEHKAMTQTFTTEQEILLQELKGKHINELELQSQQLQEKHKQQILSLTAELQTKHQTETEALKSTLQSKQQALLEAHVAKLQTKHQAQIDELEAKHLSNLDSLESSYLSEIQNIRDEHKKILEELQVHHREQLHQKDKENQVLLAEEKERLKLKHSEELLLSHENLKIELATLHIEKLKAMGAELEEVHKEELNTALQNQRCLLEEENRKALDALREEVLIMEEHHKKALQELQDLHVAEIQKQKEEYSQQLKKELKKLKVQHEHEQEMYASASASEVQTVRTALLAQFEEAKMKQQLQFQEEIELLKCQSEVLLEQQITQLKEEFEAEKKAALHNKDDVLVQEAEEAWALCRKEIEALSVQLQEKTNKIIQLEKKVQSLSNETEETNSELETLLWRRDRENQEGENLVAMLRSDIDLSQNERQKMQDSYQRLLKSFMETVKAIIATEDLICKKIGICLDDSLASGDSRESRSLMEEMGFVQHFKTKEKHDMEKSELLDVTLTEHNQVSAVTDEGSELSQYLCESIFANPDLAFENEEMIPKFCHRLRTAVEKLLELVTESTKQLEKTHEIHAQFEEEFSRRNQETAQVVGQHQELMECLNEESEAKNQLALKLHKAEGIIEGYVAEKAALEEALNLKEESERRLVVELENLRERFQELTQEQAILGLLKEVEFLAKEKVELQCQAEKDYSSLRSQMRVLEVELEEQMNHNQELEKKLLEVTDLKQQIQVLEKQLKNQRQFMDEQAIEREHERDEFQQEIQKLEEQLKLAAKLQMSVEPREHGSYELSLQVESLQSEIKEKMDDYNKLLLEKEQKHQEVTIQDKEMETMAERIREMEHTNTEVSKTVSRLEQELQRMKKMETELKQDKEALQQQQYNNLIQISALQSKLDEARHRVPTEGNTDHVLKEQLEAEKEALLMKERQVVSLLEQVEEFKENLINKNDEILQLTLELEMQKNLSTTSTSQLQLENAHLKEDIAKLSMKQNQILDYSESSVLQFPQALLEEKNQEIDHLNEQVMRLQHELENATDNKVVDDRKSEIKELESLIEHLRGDQERLRKDKEEEIEQLHGVIEKLQKELAHLGPVCHEISDSQDDLNDLGLEDQGENLQKELKKGSLDMKEDTDQNKKNVLLDSKVKELQEELELVSTAREALQQLLEERESQFKMEVEILEQNIQNVQESSRQHFKELTSLKIQYEAFQEEYNLIRTHLSQRDVEVRMISSRIQELEDTLRAREANLLERDLQIKTMAEQRVVETTELHHLTEKVVELEAELEKRDDCQQSQAIEVQALQSEVSRLGLTVQTLNQKVVVYQKEMDELQLNDTKLKDQIQEYLQQIEALLSERDELYSQLESYREKEQSNNQEAKLPKLVSKQEREVLIRTKGMERLEEDWRTDVDQSFAATVSPNNKLILIEEQLDTTNSLQNEDDIIAKMTSHQEELKSELPWVTEDLEVSEERPGSTLEDVKEKDAELTVHSRNMKTQVKQLQETLLIQEEEMTNKAEELQVDSIHSMDLETMHTRSSAIQGDTSGLFGYPKLAAYSNEETTDKLDLKSPCFSESTYSIAEYQDMEKRILVREVDNLTLTPSDSQDDVRSTVSGLERASNGYSSNSSSDLAAKLNQELETTEHLDASVLAYLQYCGMFPDRMDSVKEKEILSPQLKTVLKMVYEESRKILALSEYPFVLRDPKSVQQPTAAEGWEKEGLTLLDAIQSLKDYLSKMTDKGGKEYSDACLDWRGELLQAVQSVLEKERNMLQIDLQSHLCNPGSGDKGSLVEKLEHIMKQQEEQQQLVLEHLLSSDRSSLLSEIQDLRAQLRMTHLQNQEKLQQLQETITNAEDRGSKQEHQLRRKVELLEYKIQQEKSIASDLQNTLSIEQQKASEMRELLKQEQTAASNLKSELYESRLENEKLQKSLQDLRREINQFRCELENREKDLTGALQDLQNECLKEKELQNVFEEQQLQHKRRADEKAKELEELRATLKLQCIQNNQLSVALEHEQTANDNLRKELQIEHSRCEALLSQERTKLSELQRNLEVERNRSLELLNSLNHERILTEQLSMKAKEGVSCPHKESLLEQTFVRDLQVQLDEERSRAKELAAVIEKTHQQAIRSKRQLEAEVQMCCEETQKEREISNKLRATLESLQSQKQEVIRSLEVQREREGKLKADREELQSRFEAMKEQEKNKKEESDKVRRWEQQSEVEKQKEWQKDRERLHELELQHQRDECRIKELQQTLADLEEQERKLTSQKSHQEVSCPIKNDCNIKLAFTTETETLHLRQQLEKIRQQLLFVAVHLNEFIYKTVDKTVNDWSASNNEAIASLLHTLKELKSELLTSSTHLNPSQDPVSLVDVLLKENGELTKSVTALTDEKLELRAAVSRLEKKLQQHLHRGNGNGQIRSMEDADSVQGLERAAWQREKTVLQNALKQAESELVKNTVEIENKPVMEASNAKLQRLYKKYLRSESFRKALVYQKKYLLLLLGGFQDCEQATLSLIARMGVFPSPADLQVSESHSRPFTKFRSVVRVVIAISRLKFLVKKWNKINRKGIQGEVISHGTGHNSVSGARTEVLRQQLPTINTNSPPTRDTGLCHKTSSARCISQSHRSSTWLCNRSHPSTSSVSDKSLVSSTQDPERSLSEYIHRLEVIQQRLGGAQPGKAPGLPPRRSIKK